MKATNKTLLDLLKKMFEEAKGKWVDELPGMSYRLIGPPVGNP